ncbi:MAG TPA: hypothetical protein VML19_27075 [Verrucomicrobiae bacterium]|nr:hypothetical protein [Verrucomicrobiae bacterium]
MVISEPPVTDSEKREALETALKSQTLARSAQLRALLRYICDREMAGHSDELTEYQIAVDVLGRRKDFSLTDDSSVRNRAYELRQRLEKYYSTENPGATVRIQVPRGGYVPFYTRQALAPVEPRRVAPAGRPRRRLFAAVLLALGAIGTGLIAGWYFAKPHPPAILKEAWGPLADPQDELLISIATNFHMIVRPHIRPHRWRFPVPSDIESIYGPDRPLIPGEPLYMEPAFLSVPLAELAATATLSNMRTAFGGTYQILPESEAPVAALRGRNSVLIGSGTNSEAARALLRNLPLTIDYNAADEFAVIDQRKPAGQNELFDAQPVGQHVPSTLYGLLSVLTWPESGGKVKRTVVISGAGSAGVQAAMEFFCSPNRMRDLKARMHGFPPAYQVVVRCKTSGLRLISYEYAVHEVGYTR